MKKYLYEVIKITKLIYFYSTEEFLREFYVIGI